MVGKSGNSAERADPVVPITRSVPAAICGVTTSAGENIRSMRPPSRSVTAGPVPRYGTCSMSTAGHLREQRAGEMRRRAGAGRAERQLAGICFRVRDQFGGTAHRHVRIDHQDVGRRGDQRHRCELARHVECAALSARERQDRAGRRHQQRVAVGRRSDHLPRADHAGRARPVLGNHRLAPHGLQAGREHAAEHVGRAAGRERHDDADLPARKALRVRRRRRHEKRQGGQERAARDHRQPQ